MIAQIYSLVDPQEARDVVAAGADHIGLLVGDPNCPCCIDEDTANAIYETVGDKAVKVLISADKDIDVSIDRCYRIHPDVIHICPKPASDGVRQAIRFREAHPNIKIMLAIAVKDMTSVELAKEYEPYCDFILLDTYNPSLDGIGAAGVPHDWSVDKAIVEAVNVPVILAGGLGPDNVEEAIKFVKPAGVDSLTKTSIKENGILIRKNIELTKQFCEIAHGIEV